jgi:hypothetical protein
MKPREKRRAKSARKEGGDDDVHKRAKKILSSVGDGRHPLYTRAHFIRVCPGSKRGPKSRWLEKQLEVRINHASIYYSLERKKPSFYGHPEVVQILRLTKTEDFIHP